MTIEIHILFILYDEQFKVKIKSGASHSVSRGVPSSISDRVTSSCITTALSTHLYFSIIVYVFFYQNILSQLVKFYEEFSKIINHLVLLTHIKFYWRIIRFFLIANISTVKQQHHTTSDDGPYNCLFNTDSKDNYCRQLQHNLNNNNNNNNLNNNNKLQCKR